MTLKIIGNASLSRPIDDGPGKGLTVVDSLRSTFPGHRSLNFPLCFRHGKEVGTIDRYDFAGDTMWIEATVTDGLTAEKIERGELTGLSIGFSILQSQSVRAGEAYLANGKRRVARCDLTLALAFVGEVSVVPEPADTNCRIYSVRREDSHRVATSVTGFVAQDSKSTPTAPMAPIPIGPGGQLLLTTR